MRKDSTVFDFSTPKEMSVQDIVNKVADLIQNFCKIQNISGDGDHIPHLIATALRNGYITCPSCGGIGQTYRHPKEICRKCSGRGIIDFKIEME
jgi:hypothetical protein